MHWEKGRRREKRKGTKRNGKRWKIAKVGIEGGDDKRGARRCREGMRREREEMK